MDKTAAAYIAGIIDGEGCISITRRAPRKQAGEVNYCYWNYVAISNTDLRLLNWVKKQVGHGSLFKCGRVQNKRTHYVLNVSTIQASSMLRSAYDYLVIKQEQADVVFEFRKTFDDRRQDSVRTPQSIIAAREQCYLRLKSLHKREFA